MRVYTCCDERRRSAVRGHSILNGIEFLEVLDGPDVPEAQRQRELYVHFVNPLVDVDPDPLDVDAPVKLTAQHIRIEGGDRIPTVGVTGVSIGTGDQSRVLTVTVEAPGDFSTYTLRLVRAPQSDEPPVGYDRLLSAVDFSFKVDCDSNTDCETEPYCPPDVLAEPDINYLAKDYASFRQLMLDRMTALMPAWQERNPADVGVVLVELLAYAGDYLSYHQDAVATEAYLHTARRRVSVRRHARLVDYFMHDGCNARTWVQIWVQGDTPVQVRTHTQLLTRVPDLPIVIQAETADYRKALSGQPEVFETLHDATLYADHNELLFYTWGDERCCLPRGATRATLRGHHPYLKQGDVLIFEERLGPRTGNPDDADRTHRCAVRLVADPALGNDPLGGRLLDPPTEDAIDVTEIRWGLEDALPFPVCVSVRVTEGDRTAYYDAVSVALGNIVLADHGRSLSGEELGTVPASLLIREPAAAGDRCQSDLPDALPPRFRPRLAEAPLTFAVPFEPEASAAWALLGDVRQARPQIRLTSRLGSVERTWKPVRDLLGSGPNNPEFVAEVESDGTAFIRFGNPQPDDPFGLRPAAGEMFWAHYRVGNGLAGNIGADALYHIVIPDLDTALVKVRNPLPAQGAQNPESIQEVRQNAPQAFRTQERAVTTDDYAERIARHPKVQRAAASLRWTGSWHTVFITVDPLGGAAADPAALEIELRDYIEQYRMAGHDIEIDFPEYVSLELDMTVCVKPDVFREQVRQSLLAIFHTRLLPDGTPGVFHPDNFTFGQTVYLSTFYAAAAAVDGVDSVEITRFQRQDQDSTSALDSGKLALDRLEVARLENDPNYPKHGIFRLTLRGGK